MSDIKEKKRSSYKQGGQFDFPEWSIKDKSNKYRWISAEHLAAASDGYEPRGWAVAKDPKGNPVKRYDVVLGVMPIDQWLEVKAAKDEDRLAQMQDFHAQQAASEDRLNHEIKKAGGKTKFEFTQE